MSVMGRPTGIEQRTEDLRALYVLLKLRDDTEHADAKIVDALEHLTWFNRVMLVVPSWQDKPHAASNPLVDAAIDICREQKIPVIWGRWLWAAWPEGDLPLPYVPSHFAPAYYARAIATVTTEGRDIGAMATFLDAEPYARSAQKLALKGVALTLEHQAQIRKAVLTATAGVGEVGFIRPTSAGRESHFCWAMADLGALRCDSKTYYSKAPGYEVPTIGHPEQCEHRIDLWGCNVGLGRPEDVHRDQLKLTAQDVKALDLSVIRWPHPSCRGVWVYADYDIFAEVVQGWGS